MITLSQVRNTSSGIKEYVICHKEYERRHTPAQRRECSATSSGIEAKLLEASARYRRSDVLQRFEILVRRPESYGAYDNIFSPKCVTHVTNALNTSFVYLIFNLLAAGPAGPAERAREKDIGWALLQAGLACVLTNLFLINLPNRNAVFATTRGVVTWSPVRQK